jgi:hypothetical protein
MFGDLPYAKKKGEKSDPWVRFLVKECALPHEIGFYTDFSLIIASSPRESKLSRKDVLGRMLTNYLNIFVYRFV